jgi:hypothetical protein
MGKRLWGLHALPLVALLACARTQIWGGVTFEEEPADAAFHEAGGVDVALDSMATDHEAPDAVADSTLDGTPEGATPPEEAGDGSDGEDAYVLSAPRLLSPLSTATVTSQTPLLRWSLAAGEDGAAVDICRDRACTTLVTSFQVPGSSGMVPVALSQGVYFWRARGTAGGTSGTSFSKVWEFFVGARSTPQNLSWGTVPDVNGDGFADLLSTAPGATGKPGYLFAYLGSQQGLSSPSTFSLGNEVDAFTRDPVASAGDVNGDGFADAIVGVPELNKPSSSVYLFLGGPEGLSSNPTLVASPPGVPGEFGWVVSSAGDIDGDGYSDVVVCANVGPNEGCFLYHGGEGGLSPSPWATLASLTLPNGATGNYGYSAASAGDINGDGYGDLVFGSNYVGTYVAVFTGSATGLSPVPVFLAAPHIPNQIDQSPDFGASVACAGDVNGDGFADVIVGSPTDGDAYATTGSTYLYLGSPTGLSTAPLTLDRPTPDPAAEFGSMVAGAGDVDGDGYSDLLATTATQAFLFFGGPAGPSPVAVALPGGQANYNFGQGAIAGGGDVNGDGFADAIVGAPDGSSYVGSVLVYPGSRSGPTTPWTLIAPAGTSFLGSSVALIRTSPGWRSATRPRGTHANG